jgi:hypothetical protein
MASLSNDGGGRRRIQFMGVDGRRHSIRLGKIAQRAAEAIQVRVETLIAAAMSKTPIDADTAKLGAGQPDTMM